MKKGKFQNKGSKIVALMLAMMLVFGVAVGGTLAYLMDKTGPVTNTFTVGDINIELKETDLEGNITNVGEDGYKILPGTTQDKDPYVIVKAESEACWLFVEVEAKDNEVEGNKLITYTVGNGWKPVDGYDGVYYKEQEATTEDTNPIYILDGNKVSYSADLTKEILDQATTKPQLVFTAYAVQKQAGTDAADVWSATYGKTSG